MFLENGVEVSTARFRWDPVDGKIPDRNAECAWANKQSRSAPVSGVGQQASSISGAGHTIRFTEVVGIMCTFENLRAPSCLASTGFTCSKCT